MFSLEAKPPLIAVDSMECRDAFPYKLRQYLKGKTGVFKGNFFHWMPILFLPLTAEFWFSISAFLYISRKWLSKSKTDVIHSVPLIIIMTWEGCLRNKRKSWMINSNPLSLFVCSVHSSNLFLYTSRLATVQDNDEDMIMLSCLASLFT